MTDFPKIKTLLDLKGDDLRPMTGDESELMVAVTLSPEFCTVQSISSPLLTYKSDEELPFVLKVMLARLRGCSPDLMVAPGVILWTAQMCTNPAMAVMFAHAIHTVAKDHPERRVDMAALTSGAWAMGVPTDDAKRKIWEAQKGYTQDPPLKNVDNLIDLDGSWE